MNAHAIEKTELNKILSSVAEYATLDASKTKIQTLLPASELKTAKERLAITSECVRLLFFCGISKVEYFDPFYDELERAQKGSSLTCGELLKSAALLRSARIAHHSINSVNEDGLEHMKGLADKLYFDHALEEDITEKILNDTQLSDHASDKLYTIRREIRLLNERIRSRLSEYLSGSESKYLQDGIVTMRDNRYVLPVRAEYKRNIKGFIHDKSASGATFFIEPEEVLEMNNELRSLMVDEREEIERILSELSRRVGALAELLSKDIAVLEEIDGAYARAEFSYKLGCTQPEINDKGIVDI
jgi:DNA mismatch repair protein MutS2